LRRSTSLQSVFPILAFFHCALLTYALASTASLYFFCT
jgi:hypothetical protein